MLDERALHRTLTNTGMDYDVSTLGMRPMEKAHDEDYRSWACRVCYIIKDQATS